MSAGQGVARRTVVVGAAWAVPVIAAVIATPLAAASSDRLTFNTARDWDLNPGGKKPKIGVVVAAMDTTGPDAIGTVTIIVSIMDAAGVQQTQSGTKQITRGWGATADWTVHFDNVARGPYTITLTAIAAGVTTITKPLHGRTVLS